MLQTTDPSTDSQNLQMEPKHYHHQKSLHAPHLLYGLQDFCAVLACTNHEHILTHVILNSIISKNTNTNQTCKWDRNVKKKITKRSYPSVLVLAKDLV